MKGQRFFPERGVMRSEETLVEYFRREERENMIQWPSPYKKPYRRKTEAAICEHLHWW